MLTKNRSFVLILLLLSLYSKEIISETLEEVVVLGDWRQTSPDQEDSSVVLLDANTIEAQSTNHFEQLAYLVPNLNFAASDSRARYFQIRGIGERSGYQGTPNSSVGFLIDDIDYSGQGGIATTFDVDQIEIHRGPQGSRIGANALAGLIYIKTKDPTDEFEAAGEITLGSYGKRSFGFAVGGPLNENKNISYRLALSQDKTDGFRKNLYLKKSDTSRKDETTSRFKMNWQMNEKTSIKLLISLVDLDDPADVWTLDGSLNTLSDRPGMDSQKTNSYGLKVFHNFNGFDLKSLTSSTNTEAIFSYDADWGNKDSWNLFVYDYFSETLRDRKTVSQEFRLVSNEADLANDEKIEWILGVSYSEIEESNLKNDDGNYSEPSDPYGPYFSQSSSSSNYKSENFSLFGNLGYFLSETLELSLGMRWEDWQSDYVDTLGDSFNPSNDMTGGKVSLIKNLEVDTSLFVSIAKGYKQGGFNLGLGLESNSLNQNLLYDPEYLTNYEFGVNSKILDSRINLSAVIFYSDRKDQQVFISSQVDPSDPNTFSFLTKNAAEGLNYGLEMNVNIDLDESLYIFANLGLLETEIKNWKSRPDLEGRSQAHAPKRSYTVGLNWKPAKNYFLRLDVTGKSSFYYSDSHDKQSQSYSLTNLSLGYQEHQWKAELWVRNTFDKYYSVRGFYFGNEPPNFEDTLYERHGDPRHFGLSFRYDL